MADRWFTVRRHDGDADPGLDVSRVLILGFLIAAIIGLASGVGWVGCNLLKAQFGG